LKTTTALSSSLMTSTASFGEWRHQANLFAW
jgi:hypothetical protein